MEAVVFSVSDDSTLGISDITMFLYVYYLLRKNILVIDNECVCIVGICKSN